MANNIDLTNFTEAFTITNYFQNKSSLDAIELIAKKFKKVNRNIARAIAEDIVSRYEIRITHLVSTLTNEPEFFIEYRRKEDLEKEANQ